MTIRDIAIAFDYEIDAKSEKKVNDSINKLKSTATKVLGAIGIGFSLVNINKIIEEFGKVNTQIKNATNGLENQKEIQNEIISAANAARVAYADIAGVTAKLVQQNRDLFDVTSAARYAELTTKLFKSENKSQGEIVALQEAINKSFAKGAVEAETVNQIMEKSPAAANLLAKKLGTSRTELARMASEGKISLEQLRDAFLGSADDIEAAFANVDLTISDALLNIRNQWGLWLTQMDKTLGVTKTIAKIMTRTFTQFMNLLRKVQTYTERLVTKLGGSENALKLIAIAASAIFVALNAGKILAFLKTAKSLVSAISLKTIALVAAIVLIALAIDDFINFMKGNDSVIGAIFEKWGIDADGVRKGIIQTWDKIKQFLLRTWGAVKEAFGGFITFISGLITGDWSKAFGGLKSIVGAAFDYIDDVFGKFAPVVKVLTVAFASLWAIMKAISFGKMISGAITATAKFFTNTVAVKLNSIAVAANTAVQKTWNVVSKAGQGIAKGLGTAFKFLASPAGLAVIAIAALVAIIVMLIKNGGDVDALVQQFTEGIGKFVSVIEKVVAGIAEKAPQIVEAIVGAVTKVLSVIVEKLPMFIDMGIKLIMSLLDGIIKMLPAIIDAVIKLIISLVNAVVGLLPKLIDAGIKLIVSLIEGIVSMLPTIIDAIIKLVIALVNAVVDLLPKLIEAGILLVTSLIEGIVGALPQVIAAIVGLIPVLVKAITDNLPKIIKAGIQIILSLVKGIVGAVPQIVQAIVDLIPVIVQALIDALPQIIMSGIEIVIALAGGLIQAIPELIKAIPQIIMAIVQALWGLATMLWDAFTGIFSAAWEGVKAVFAGVGDFFKGIWDGIVGIFSGIGEFFSNMFKNAVDGIMSAFSGIKDFFKNIFDAVGNIIKAPINFIIKGINSFIGMLNKIKIPDWVPLVGGKGINLPTIPLLAKGGVLKKGQTGYLEGNGAEAVVPLEKNTGWVKKVADLFKQNMSGSEADAVKGIGGGIVEAVKGIGGVVGNAMKAVSEKAASAKSNADNSGITDAIRAFGANIATLAKGATASPGTVQSMVTSTTNRSVTQNNYFESTFNGDRAAQKRSSEAMNKSANDATGELARALAFAR